MSELFAICRTFEISDGEARGFNLSKMENGQAKPWPIFITRKGNGYYGFENSCPHQGLPLDVTPGEFLDEDGNFLTCGHHQSQFDLDTGHCFIGPCQGKDLPKITLVIDDGDVCVTDVELAEEDGMDLDDSEGAPDVMITPE
jgi:nitrite reductase/ring-hydroxylating ferredoxin subunit